MLFRDVLHHPEKHVGLAQRFLLIGLCAVIQVGEAQRGPVGVMRQTTARDGRFFQVAAQVIDGLSVVFRLLRQVDVPVLATSGQYQTAPVAFTEDVGQRRRHRQLRKRLSQQ
nr:truncated ORF2 [Pseudomonas savastanoi pv. phaseolicola]